MKKIFANFNPIFGAGRNYHGNGSHLPATLGYSTI